MLLIFFFFKIIDGCFDKHKQELKTAKTNYAEVVKSAQKTMSSVDDIKETSGAASLKNAGKSLQDRLSKMASIASKQQNAWHSYESKNANTFNDVQTIINNVTKLISLYSGGEIPIMESYVSGSFKQQMGVNYTQYLNGIQNYNAKMAKVTAHNNRAINQVNKQQHVFEKQVKKARVEQNKREGRAQLGMDALFFVVGTAITIATGGTATPFLLLLPGLTFTVADLYEDFDKARTGKNEGDNLVKGGYRIIGNKAGLSKKQSDSFYSSTEFIAGMAGSGKAYGELAKEGYLVEADNAAEPIVKTLMEKGPVAAGKVVKNNSQLGMLRGGMTPQVGAKAIQNSMMNNNAETLRDLGTAYGKEFIKGNIKKETQVVVDEKINKPILNRYQQNSKNQYIDGIYMGKKKPISSLFVERGLVESEGEAFNVGYGKLEDFFTNRGAVASPIK
ncbi:hypothetical protein [Ligilactobacillus acidipiscis]|uniref:hypothetical protein n=1 Tax=Ligilactobacillus acidipiscis TaxID=89059 RepID=UPI0023F79F92|nr:hypothetical protein [Ligilactobacillus acidipiscis]WEV56411.1 hypothetical protein OZX66_09285 [Ligilactobacillus acidipiscis]